LGVPRLQGAICGPQCHSGQWRHQGALPVYLDDLVEADDLLRLTLGNYGRWSFALTDLSVGNTGNAHDREQCGCNQSDLFHQRPPFANKRMHVKNYGRVPLVHRRHTSISISLNSRRFIRSPRPRWRAASVGR